MRGIPPVGWTTLTGKVSAQNESVRQSEQEEKPAVKTIVLSDQLLPPVILAKRHLPEKLLALVLPSEGLLMSAGQQGAELHRGENPEGQPLQPARSSWLLFLPQCWQDFR